MGKKSLTYIGAGVFFIMYAVLDLFSGIWQMMGHVSFDFLRGGMFKFYLRDVMDFFAWVSFAFLIIAGLVCIAKAFVDDMIPDIALAGVFCVLALCAVLAFFKRFFNMFDYRGFRYFINYVTLFSIAMEIVAFGLVAAMIFLKGGLASLFFAPAAVKALQTGMWFLVYAFGMFGTRSYGIAFSMGFVITEMFMVIGLFAVSKAVNEK
jgi:hypothetical protein